MKRLSYVEDARCLKVKFTVRTSKCRSERSGSQTILEEALLTLKPLLFVSSDWWWRVKTLS